MKKIMKCCTKIVFGLSMALLSGCAGANNYYMFSVPSSLKVYNKQLPTIGVEKISLPQYMQQGKVATQLSSTQISYSKSSNWTDEMDESLTKEMISHIQKSFNQPNVYEYPWDLSQQAGIKIKVSIGRFIVYGDFVYLDATYTINDLQNNKEYSKLFSIKVPSDKDTASVVSNMNEAFNKLSSAIVNDLNQKF